MLAPVRFIRSVILCALTCITGCVGCAVGSVSPSFLVESTLTRPWILSGSCMYDANFGLPVLWVSSGAYHQFLGSFWALIQMLNVDERIGRRRHVIFSAKSNERMKDKIRCVHTINICQSLYGQHSSSVSFSLVHLPPSHSSRSHPLFSHYKPELNHQSFQYLGSLQLLWRWLDYDVRTAQFLLWPYLSRI